MQESIHFKNLLGFFLLVISFLIIGCSGSIELGSEEIVEKSSSTPDWIITGTQDDGENLFVIGEITKAQNRSFGLKQAYADGLGNLINTLENKVKTACSQAMEGNNITQDDIGLYSKFAVAWASDTRKYAGVQNPEKYWEKVAVKTSTGVSYYYNCYSLLMLSKIDYNRILEGAFEEVKNAARERNNKKAEEAANKLLENLNN